MVALPALLPGLVAGLVALAAAGGGAPLVGAVLLAQAAFLLAWFRCTGLPAAGSGLALGAAAALGADLAALLGAGTPSSAPRHIAAVLGCGVVLAFVVQLARRDGRPQVAASLAATVTAVVLAAVGGLWVVAAGTGSAATSALAAGLAAGALPMLLPAPWWSRALLAAAAGAVLGVGAAALASAPLGAGSGLWLGVAGGIVGAAGTAATARIPEGVSGVSAVRAVSAVSAAPALRAARASVPRPSVPVTATLPVLLAGPLAYGFGSLVGSP